MTDFHALLPALGLLSFGISLLAYLPYARDILVGSTKPQRSSWLIWTVVASIAFFSQIAEGASHSLWFAGANWLVTVSVFLASLRYGSGAFLRPEDRLTLALAAFAMGLWCLTDNAAIALSIAILINGLAGALTVAKAYAEPGSETLSTWVLGGVSSLLGVVSVGAIDVVLMAYPAYLAILYTAVASAILCGRRAQLAKVCAVGHQVPAR